MSLQAQVEGSRVRGFKGSRELLAVAVAWTVLAVHAAAGPLPKDVAAVVNGVAISRRNVSDVVQALAATRDESAGTTAAAALRKQALDSLVEFELLYQDGQARHLEVSDAAVADVIKNTEASFGSPAAYRRALEAKGLTRADIERDTRKTLVVNRLLEDVVWQTIRIDENAIRAFYEENRERFKHPAEIRASHILIRAPKTGASGDAGAARKKAENLARRARGGESFAALARAESEDPATAQHGGDLGFFPPGTMVDAFEDVAFRMKPGEISDVIQTPFGFHVITVTAVREAGIAPVDEVRERIAAVLGQERRQQLQDAFVADLRRKATITIAPDLR